MKDLHNINPSAGLEMLEILPELKASEEETKND